MRITKYDTRINRINNRPDVIKEKSVNYSGFQKLDNPSAIVQVMNDLFDVENLTEEHMYMLTTNVKLNFNGVFEVSHGGMSSCALSPKDLLSKAILCGAYGIVLLHNHPSGYSLQSSDDVNFTKRMNACCELLDLEFFDHIIVGYGEYLSFREENLL